MNRFLVVLALVCCGSIAAQADTITLSTPAPDSGLVGGSVDIVGTITSPTSLAETVAWAVTLGPDAGEDGSVTLSPSDSFVIDLMNTSDVAGVDTIQAGDIACVSTAFAGVSLCSNTVSFTWVTAPVTAPEPSSFLLLLIGIAGLALLGRRRWPHAIGSASPLG